MQADITQRTKTDGSLSRILEQPGILNPFLPPSELPRVGFHRIDLILVLHFGEHVIVIFVYANILILINAAMTH